MAGEKSKKSVIILGGGLVGSLCACLMAKRGYNVTVYERRNDFRKCELSKGRSINLALSHRGRQSLKLVGLEDKIIKIGIPMKGRLLHSANGKNESIPYDAVSNQCIYSVGRNYLNLTLLEAIENHPDVKLCFNEKLIRANFEEKTVTLLNTISQETHIETADLIIGSDGAFSSLRKSMLQRPLFDFSQQYIEHGYMELSVPPSRGDRMTPNHLHIWPRGEFMMIALPNQDNSWTVTLFMPFKKFDTLKTEDDLLNFFNTTFPDAITLIGEKELLEIFFNSKPSHLVSIKCNSYHVGDKFLIIGDAAHAMVPFYGQGMNSGFEDCTILNNLLDKNNDDFQMAIKEFSEIRVKDAQAICDLAMYNYVEMRDLVTRPTYRLRKKFDELLFRIFHNNWVPLYNSVSFSNMEYKKCIDNRKWQDKVINIGLLILGASFLLFLYFLNLILDK